MSITARPNVSTNKQNSKEIGSMQLDHLIPPYKGMLNNLIVSAEQAEAYKRNSDKIQSIVLTRRQECDLEMLLNGALSPLTGFMNEETYSSVLSNTQLPDGTLWPIPFTLDVTEKTVKSLQTGSEIALLDSEGVMLAVLNIESIWQPDKKNEAEYIYGTSDTAHPGVDYLFNKVNKYYIGGKINGIQLPFHYDFETLRDTPGELRCYFEKLGWRNIVAFHTSKPMHRVHYEMTMRASKDANAHILIHPVVGMSKPGDILYHARVHCYQAIKRHYPHNLAALSLLPMAIRMAGPREALMNAIIRQNYGCSHYIVGTEHSSPPNVRDGGKRFYRTGESQEYVKQYQDKLDIKFIYSTELCYVENERKYMPSSDAIKEGYAGRNFSNSQIMRAIEKDEKIPEWATFTEVIKELHKVSPPRKEQGFTLFFTGLSGSGKSTLAKILYAGFIESGDRPVTLLDGDIVRHNLSNELGFSKEHRDINVRRIGFVASEITKNRGIAICAPIAPYATTRNEVRAVIEEYGAFIEIHVSTPLEVCEERDRKGLYAKARKGLIPEFTGISDPYEKPLNPELRIDTTKLTPMQAVQEINLYLIREGYITHSI